MVRVIGFDPSLTSYGLSDGERNVRIRTTPEMGSTYDRVQYLFVEIGLYIAMTPSPVDSFVFVIEGPSFGSAMAGALWDAGYLMCRFDQVSREYGATVYVVPPATLKKFVTGKGNTPKADMALQVFKKWKIEFEDDRGADKLHAYCLWRFGEAILAGKAVLPPSKPRGKGRDATASRRAAAKTKAGMA